MRAGVIEGSKFGLGKALVVAQVALSLVLVVGAGLMLATFFRLETLDPGFEREHVLLVKVDLRNGNYRRNSAARSSREMLERLRALPGVRSASASDVTPVGGSLLWTRMLEIEGYTSKGGEDTLVYFNEVSDRYFETLGTDLLAGRDFNAHDTPKSPKVAIVNQTHGEEVLSQGRIPLASGTGGTADKLGDLVRNRRRGQGRKIQLAARTDIHPTVYLAASQDETRIRIHDVRTACRGGRAHRP